MAATGRREIRRRPGLLQAAVVLAPLALLAERAWAYRWMSDDGFINLRVVNQITAGNGPVLNAGERVEVATSALWVWLLAGFDLLTPIRLEWLAVGLGIAFTVGGAALAAAGAGKLARPSGDDTFLVPVGLLVIAALAPVWEFASSGLEGGLTFGWIGACLFAMARRARTPSTRPPWLTAVLIGLGPVVRPDFAIFTAVFLVALLWQSGLGPTRRRLAILGAALAVPVAYEVFRAAYYAVLVPNTALAKEASRSDWRQGLHYLSNFSSPYYLWLPAIVLVVAVVLPQLAGAAKRERDVFLVGAAFPIAAVLHALYVVKVGGDFMHARMLLPALFAFLAPVAVVRVESWLVRAGVAIVAVWAVACLVAWRPPELARSKTGIPTADRYGIGDERELSGLLWARADAVTVNDFLHRSRASARADNQTGLYVPGATGPVPVRLAPGAPPTLAVTFSLGLTSYVARLSTYVVDLRGLGDPITARLQVSRRGRPGHEKLLPPAWFAARFLAPGARVPDILDVLVSNQNSVTDPRLTTDFNQSVVLARRVLRCGRVEQVAAATRARLTPSRLVRNLWDSLPLTTMRIPPDPALAAKRFC